MASGLTSLVVVTEQALLIARPSTPWAVEQHLQGKSPDSVAVDPADPTRLYCGTSGEGLWIGHDGGRTWDPAGAGIAHPEITSVAVGSPEHGRRFGVVYVGTEPSTIFRSDDGGATWRELSGLRTLPSSRSWSFPPRPETHHVRWIEPNRARAGEVFVAIEAGALVRTRDGGQTWLDRVAGGPFDTHTAATHLLEPNRVYSAAGDGYFETTNAGETWARRVDGLEHRYLVGVAVDPADPNTVVVSASEGPWTAYRPPGAAAYVYRRTTRQPFALAMQGLPEGRGTTASRFATSPGEQGGIYAANNRGTFRSEDAGRTWGALDIPWPPRALARGVEALASFPS